MEIIETSLRGVPLLTLMGEADHAVDVELAEKSERALSRGGDRLLLDLQACPYLDSGALNVIVDLVQEVAPQGWVGVVNASAMVLRLLALVGLTSRESFRAFESMAEAERAAAGLWRPQPNQDASQG